MSKPVFNAAHALDRAARAHPRRASIHYGEESWTVEEATLETRKLAQLLAQCGVGEGDRVMLVAHNSPYHLFLHVACARLGAIFVPVSHRLARPELQELVDFCGPRVVVVEPEVGESGTFESTGVITHFVIDDDPQAPPFSPATSAGYLGLTAGANAFNGKFITTEKKGTTALNTRVYPEGPAALIFTSGSAGKPKAVALTHENLWWGSRNFRDGFEYSQHDVELVVAPMSHIGGFNGTTLDLFINGGTVVVAREFNPGALLRELAEHRVAMMFGVPTIYAALLDHPDFTHTDLSHFRAPLVGGAPVPPKLLERMEAAGLRPINVWGMTETAASGCFLSPDLLATQRGSIGRPFAQIEARIVADGEDVAVGEPGELIVRGPSVATSYWHDDEATRAAFKDGWLHTGDVVVLNDAGFMLTVGRLHNRINSGGEKIMPEEVNAALSRYPGVSGCAVVGVPDELWGESVAAALIMEPGATAPSLAELNAFAAQFIARFKLPRVLRVVDVFPTNANGKIDMGAVRALFAEQE